MKMIFLVDGDNNINEGLTGIDMLSEEDAVIIFHQKGAALTKIKEQTVKSKASIEFYESAKGGKNSIDFQIIAELGVLIGKNEVEFAYIISHDKGYASPIAALKKRYSKAFKEVDVNESIEKCLKLPFVLKATTRNELSTALVKEYGNAHGILIYNHLKSIFKNQLILRMMSKATKIMYSMVNNCIIVDIFYGCYNGKYSHTEMKVQSIFSLYVEDVLKITNRKGITLIGPSEGFIKSDDVLIDEDNNTRSFRQGQGEMRNMGIVGVQDFEYYNWSKYGSGFAYVPIIKA